VFVVIKYVFNKLHHMNNYIHHHALTTAEDTRWSDSSSDHINVNFTKRWGSSSECRYSYWSSNRPPVRMRRPTVCMHSCI